jgi:hypothetical protein
VARSLWSLASSRRSLCSLASWLLSTAVPSDVHYTLPASRDAFRRDPASAPAKGLRREIAYTELAPFHPVPEPWIALTVKEMSADLMTPEAAAERTG